MKPSGARTLVNPGSELLSQPTEATTTRQSEPTPLPVSDAQELAELDRRHKEFLHQQALKKAEEAEMRSKLKTQQLLKLCGLVMHRERESEAWFAKYEKFFRSPVWKLVSDEAIRKARFKCEYSKCTRQATRAQLLEFPEEHLEPNFDWMNRNNILMALCEPHHWMMYGFVMKRVVPAGRQFDSLPRGLSSLLASSTVASVGPGHSSAKFPQGSKCFSPPS